jgi:arylsulfatase
MAYRFISKFERMYKNLRNIFFLLSLLICYSSCKDKSLNDQLSRPNIILIVADDLGFTDLGCFGSEIKTPNLDALAYSGIRNNSFYTAPTCSPTRAMLLSGVDNHRNGYGTMEGDWAENQIGLRGYEGHLNFDVVAFPKLLQKSGYHTSLAGKWHQAFPSTKENLWPQKRGFDRSFNLVQGGAGHFSDQQKLFSFFDRTRYIQDDKIVEILPDDFYSSDFYTQKIIEYIDESVALKKPFFSYLSYTAPHWPLQVPDEYIDLYKGRYDAGYEVLAQERFESLKLLGFISDSLESPGLPPNVPFWDELSTSAKKRSSRTMEVYSAMVELLDVNVGKLVDHLKSIGQYENTLIIFMADNGAEGNSLLGIADTEEWISESFDNSLDNIGRKNSYVFTGPSWAHVSSLPFKWYKAFSTEGGVRCPSFITYPGWTQNSGKITNEIISVMDIAPTILDLAGVTHPGNEFEDREIYPMDGISLLGWLEGKQDSVRDDDEAHCWELYGRIGVRKGDWKAEWYDSPYGTEAWELYHIINDPAEQINLAKDYPEKLKELKTEWDNYAVKYQVTLPNEKVAYGRDEFWRKE